MAVEVVSLKRALEMLREAGVDPKFLDAWEKHDDLKQIRREFRALFPNVYMGDV